MDDDAPPDLLSLAIASIMAEADHPLTPAEVAEELARRALAFMGLRRLGPEPRH